MTSTTIAHLLTSLLLGFTLLAPAQEPTTDPAFGLHVPAPGPSVFADDILQAAIDKVSQAGGGTLILGAGDFKLSRKAGDETVIIRSNITLRGQGYTTHIYLDPTTPPNPIRYYPMRIGTADTPASNIIIENLRYTGNNAHIGGGSIMGFNARLDAPEAELLPCDNITVHHCWIYDAQQAVGCTKKRSAKNYNDPERLAAQFKNWQVHHNLIDTCGNKAIELAECNGGLMADNYITNVDDGPQAIFGSRNIRIANNQVFFTNSGINITEGSHHITVTGNIVEPAENINPSASGACLVFRTEPQPQVSTISHITVTGNIFRNQITKQKTTMKFYTRPESLGCTYEAITLTGNVFDGDIQFVDRTTPKMTTVKDIIFADNICEGQLLTVPAKEMASTNIVVRGNLFRYAGNQTLNASGWIWTDNTLTSGSLEVAPGTQNNLIRNNLTPKK